MLTPPPPSTVPLDRPAAGTELVPGPQPRPRLLPVLAARLAPLSDRLSAGLVRSLPWLEPVSRRVAAGLGRHPLSLTAAIIIMAGIGAGLALPPFLAKGPRTAFSGPAAAAPELPRHLARRLGEELEISVVAVPDGTALFATGPGQLASALALSRRTAAGDGIVVSVDALTSAARRLLAAYGLDGLVTVAAAPGPALVFRGTVPAALFAVKRLALGNIATLVGQDPVLRGVSLRDETARDDELYFRAMFLGEPKSVVYTTDGPREVGQAVFGGFLIRDLRPDRITLRPIDGMADLTVTVPLRDPSAATAEGAFPTALPDRASVVIDRQPPQQTEK